jgi:hypothetical protein
MSLMRQMCSWTSKMACTLILIHRRGGLASTRTRDLWSLIVALTISSRGLQVSLLCLQSSAPLQPFISTAYPRLFQRFSSEWLFHLQALASSKWYPSITSAVERSLRCSCSSSPIIETILRKSSWSRPTGRSYRAPWLIFKSRIITKSN